MSMRSASKSIAVNPSASARMRRFTSLVTKIVGSFSLASRTSSATIRIRWSAIWLSRSVVGTERAADSTRSRPPESSGAPSADRRAPPARSRSSTARHFTGVAATLGGLFLELVDLLQHEDRNHHIVVGELEHGPRIVDEDVCIEDEVFHGEPTTLQGEELIATPAVAVGNKPPVDRVAW